MHTELRHFVTRFAGVVQMTLMPIAFITFVSVPLNLNRHPGDLTQHSSAPLPQHMT